MSNPLTKRAVVFGATGTLGSALCTTLQKNHFEVVAVCRNVPDASQTLPGMSEYVQLDFKNPNQLLKSLEGASYVINLSGAPLFGKRLTEKYKQELYDSRVGLTKNIITLLTQLSHKPSVFVSASAIGYYGFHEITDQEFSENDPAAHEYQGSLTSDWEDAAKEAANLGIRTVCIRTGIVLNRAKKGALAQLLLPFYFFVGGTVGIAATWRSWIHIDDEIGLILHALKNQDLKGPINATSPYPVTNATFSQTIAKVIRRPAWLPVPELLIRLIFGEVAEVVTRGKKIIPQKALTSGYQFHFPHLEEALRDLLKK